MYLPYKAMTAQTDTTGNLQLWIGKNAPKPTAEEKIATIETNQDKATIYSYCFDLTEETKTQIDNGNTGTIYLHQELIADIFS